MKSERRFTRLLSLPYLAVAAGALILFAPILIKGEAIFWGTPILQFYPWRYLAFEMMTKGIVPLWNPLVGMGAPLLANYQIALFYPPNWTLFLMALGGRPEAMAWGQTLLAMLHVAWAGLGMIRLTKDLKFSPLAQTISGLAFSLSGYMIGRTSFLSINAAAAWLPWVVWGAHRLATTDQGDKRAGLKNSVRLGVMAGMQLLAGHAQTTFYTLILAGVWAFYWEFGKKETRRTGRLSLWLAAAGTIAIGLAAVQLLPTAEYMLNSQRGAMDYDEAMTYSFWGWRLLTLFSPDLFGNPANGDYWGYGNYWEDATYIGLLPVLLGMAAFVICVFGRKGEAGDKARRRLALFLGVLTAASFILALGWNMPLYPLFYTYVTKFILFQAPTRVSIWAVFALSVLAGMGADAWRPARGRWLYALRLGTAGALSITLVCAILLAFRESNPVLRPLMGIKGSLISGTLYFGVMLFLAGLAALGCQEESQGPRRARYWTWAVALLALADLVAAHRPLLASFDLSLFGDAAAKAASTREQLSHKRLYIPAEVERKIKFTDFFTFSSFSNGSDWGRVRDTFLPNLNILDGIASVNNFDPMVPERYDKWMAWVDEASGAEREALLRRMDAGLEAEAYDPDTSELKTRAIAGGERLRWANCAVFAEDGEAALGYVKLHLNDGDDNGLKYVILEGDAAGEGENCFEGTAAEMQIIKDEPLETSVVVKADGPGWVAAADVWYPGWYATLDGQEAAEIYRADYLFRGVRVTAGEHRIDFAYRPWSFGAGCGISIAASLCIIVMLRRIPGSNKR